MYFIHLANLRHFELFLRIVKILTKLQDSSSYCWFQVICIMECFTPISPVSTKAVNQNLWVDKFDLDEQTCITMTETRSCAHER